MALSYSRLGDYIQQVDVKNVNSDVDELIGVSISKEFIKSVANIIGTDLSKYKIISKGQFACSLMQVSRDGGVAISLYKEDKKSIVSPAYYIFEVNEEGLLPEYLYLVVCNSMFDREAVFNAVGGIRGTLTWEDFCNIRIKIPSIKKQKEIVEQEKVISNRINVLEQVNNKLIEMCELQIKEYNQRIERSEKTFFIPIRDLVKTNTRNYSKSDSFEEIIYLETGAITDNQIYSEQVINPQKKRLPSRCKRKVEDRDIIFSTVRPNNRHFGILYNPPENYLVSTGFSVLSASQNRISPEFIYMWLTSEDILIDINEIAELSVTTYPSISNDDLLDVMIEVPDDYDFSQINEVLHSAMLMIDLNNRELRDLTKLRKTFLEMII